MLAHAHGRGVLVLLDACPWDGQTHAQASDTAWRIARAILAQSSPPTRGGSRDGCGMEADAEIDAATVVACKARVLATHLACRYPPRKDHLDTGDQSRPESPCKKNLASVYEQLN
jgi:hypothetical protein